MKRFASAFISLVLSIGLLASPAMAAPPPDNPDQHPDRGRPVKSENYEWGRAKIVGGGFIPGIIFNTKMKNLIYARTDIGGAYRWDPLHKKWIQLLDSVSMEDWNLTGVESLATDPVEPNRVYIAAGTYTNGWTDQNGAILRSVDFGKSWKRTPLPFKLGGNMPGRSMGERLAIDPNNDRILYFGARSGNGLWRSTDYGATWSRVDSFPATGDVSEDYFKDPLGVVWVTFDPTTGSRGHATQTIYVGVADRTDSIYMTTDGGATWKPVPGQPEQGYLPHHGVLSSNGNLYVTYAHDVGPYNGGEGSVWKYDTKTGAWTDISPTGAGDTSNPYGGLAVDAQHPDTVMVATMNKWWPDEFIYRSTDGGATWKPFSAYDYSVGWPPKRTDQFTIDYSLAPWLDWGVKQDPTQTPEISPKLGWMIGDLEIDPFNSDRFLYGTGATLYGSDDLTEIDAGNKITIKVYADGIEETAILGLISPPSGAPLLSAMGDIGGFRHDDLNQAPHMLTNPTFSTTTDLDYAEQNPNIVVKVGSNDNSKMGVSSDNGATWQPAANAGSPTGGGWVAVGADGANIVWSPDGASVSRSTDKGATWTASQGIPQGAIVSSDRVNPNKFYGFSDGTFYVSTDGGATFAATAATGLPRHLTSKFKAVPGIEGDVWLAGASDNDHPDGPFGLYHSTDSGNTFTKVAGVDEAATVGFGKAAPGSDYMALYTYAEINGKFGIYRSDDAGSSWIRINDDEHQFGNANRTITGDPRVFGRVYVGTNGFGIVVGDAAGNRYGDDRGDDDGHDGGHGDGGEHRGGH